MRDSITFDGFSLATNRVGESVTCPRCSALVNRRTVTIARPELRLSEEGPIVAAPWRPRCPECPEEITPEWLAGMLDHPAYKFGG